MCAFPSHSTLHFDTYQNFLCVVKGRKTVTLFPPNYTPYLNAAPISTNNIHHALSDGSDLPSEAEIVQKEGKHFHGREMAGKKVILEAGDVLFIPEGWWHQVCLDLRYSPIPSQEIYHM